MSDDALHLLAREAGLQVRWEDAGGQAKTVAPDDLAAILDAMGLRSGSEVEVEHSRQALRHSRELADASFLSAGAGEDVEAPALRRPGPSRAEDEEGRSVELEVGEGIDGVPRLRAPDRPGYYRLETGGTVLAVAPARAWTVADVAPGRRLWGAAAQVYSLRGGGLRSGEAFGDFGALAEMAGALGQRGADALAASPTHALFAADPGRYGPYAPSTRLFLNVLFADALILGGEPGGSAGGELIDWRAAAPAKLARLRTLFERFDREAAPDDRAALDRFRREQGSDLVGHARFEALHAHFTASGSPGGWQAWPDAFHDSGGEAVQQFAAEHAREVDFHVFLQWLADLSLGRAQAEARGAGMAIGLVADLAVGMDAGGSHAWSRPGDLLQGLSVGAPPDIFQPAGQDWGLAAFSPLALRRGAFQPFIATLRAAMRHAGGVRIDHAMGLRRLWLTPRGRDAHRGAYLTYPFDDMLRLIALESWRNRCIVVGEDLGTVPPGFREETTAAGMFGMRVLWFERDGQGDFTPPDRWAREAMAMTSTHDLPTVAGWWRGGDIDWMERLERRGQHADIGAERRAREIDRGRLWSACKAAGVAEGVPPAADQAQDAVDAAAAYVARSGCALAILPLEDLLGLEEQPNHPGTTDEAPNWRRRLSGAPDALLDAPRVAARLESLRRERPQAGGPA